MRKAKILIATLSMLVSALSPTYGQMDDFGQPVWKALRSYDKAWNTKDVAAVSKILADGYVYFSSTGALTRRKATLDFLGSPDYKLTFVERSEVELLSYDANTAVVSSRWKGRGTYGKEIINDDQRCGLVFIKKQNDWKLLSEHCAQIVSK